MNALISSLKAIARKVYSLGQRIDTVSNEVSDLRNAQAQGIDEQAVTSIVTRQLNTLTEGADEALDTLKEIGDKIKSGDTAVASILEEIAGVKTRVNALEEFTGIAQKETLETEINRLMTTGA